MFDFMDEHIFFDLDGTLTDPKPGITRCIQYALEKLSAEVPVADDLTWCIGPPLITSFRTLVGEQKAQIGVDYYRERFADIGLYENSVYAGVHDMLNSLSARQKTLFVASSKPLVFVEKILKHFDLDNYFSGVFGSELDGTRSDKSELLKYALTQTNSTAANTTMIGDRKHDVIGAVNNGIRPIGVLYGYGSAEELTDAGALNLAPLPTDLDALL